MLTRYGVGVAYETDDGRYPKESLRVMAIKVVILVVMEAFFVISFEELLDWGSLAPVEDFNAVKSIEGVAIGGTMMVGFKQEVFILLTRAIDGENLRFDSGGVSPTKKDNIEIRT